MDEIRIAKRIALAVAIQCATVCATAEQVAQPAKSGLGTFLSQGWRPDAKPTREPGRRDEVPTTEESSSVDRPTIAGLVQQADEIRLETALRATSIFRPKRSVLHVPKPPTLTFDDPAPKLGPKPESEPRTAPPRSFPAPIPTVPDVPATPRASRQTAGDAEQSTLPSRSPLSGQPSSQTQTPKTRPAPPKQLADLILGRVARAPSGAAKAEAVTTPRTIGAAPSVNRLVPQRIGQKKLLTDSESLTPHAAPSASPKGEPNQASNADPETTENEPATAQAATSPSPGLPSSVMDARECMTPKPAYGNALVMPGPDFKSPESKVLSDQPTDESNGNSAPVIAPSDDRDSQAIPPLPPPSRVPSIEGTSLSLHEVSFVANRRGRPAGWEPGLIDSQQLSTTSGLGGEQIPVATRETLDATPSASIVSTAATPKSVEAAVLADRPSTGSRPKWKPDSETEAMKLLVPVAKKETKARLVAGRFAMIDEEAVPATQGRGPSKPLAAASIAAATAEDLTEQSRQRLQRAFSRFDSGDRELARVDATDAVRLIVAARDKQQADGISAAHFRRAEQAIRESADFVRLDDAGNLMPMEVLITSHTTDLLREKETEGLSPLVATQTYLAAAQADLVTAVSGSVEASDALALLGKIEKRSSSVSPFHGAAVALTLQRAAVDARPANAIAHFELGETLREQGLNSMAVESLRKSAQLRPAARTYQSLLQVAEAIGDAALANECRRELQALGASPDAPRVAVGPNSKEKAKVNVGTRESDDVAKGAASGPSTIISKARTWWSSARRF